MGLFDHYISFSSDKAKNTQQEKKVKFPVFREEFFFLQLELLDVMPMCNQKDIALSTASGCIIPVVLFIEIHKESTSFIDEKYGI